MTAGGRTGASPAGRRLGSVGAWALGAIIAVDIAAGVAAVVARLSTGSQPSQAADVSPGPGRSAPPARPAPPPTSVVIPRIDVRADLVRLGLAGDGSLETPGSYGAAGWWTGGASPGAVGPAVIVGHRDSRTGPAVFFGVSSLNPGDEVVVGRSDGSRVTFVVDEILQVSKAEFPTERVYGPTAAPTLRLITCGGRFDRRAGAYDDNVVVLASLAPEPTAAPS